METVKKRGGIRWADALLAAATLLLAALLVFQCLAVYRAGTAPENLGADGVRLQDIYTREGVSLRLSSIAWAFWLWVAALAAALACRHAHPLAPKPPRPALEMQLWLMNARREPTPAMKQEEAKRCWAGWLCGGVCLLCAALGARYLLDPATFASTDLETVMTAVAIHVGPPVAAGFAALMVLAQVRYRSMQRELAAAKEAPLREDGKPQPQKAAWKPGLQAALLLAALGLIVAGVLNGGMYDVLVKAVNICTECIGLG